MHHQSQIVSYYTYKKLYKDVRLQICPTLSKLFGCYFFKCEVGIFFPWFGQAQVFKVVAEAKDKGFSDVLFLDAGTGKNIEEVS